MTTPDQFLFSEEQPPEPSKQQQQGTWQVLVVDDDPTMHQLTSLTLVDFEYDNKGLDFIYASSGQEAIEKVKEHPEIALILLDVIMETDDAGFNVVKYIRNELQQNLVRIVLRTGQAGSMAEREIIREFDISDFKSKTDLSSERLHITVISALRSYKELLHVEANRQALLRLLSVQEQLEDCKSPQEFSHKMLELLAKHLPFYRIFDKAHKPVSNQLVQVINGKIQLLDGLGSLADDLSKHGVSKIVEDLITRAIAEQKPVVENNFLAIPINTHAYPGQVVWLSDNPKMKNAWEQKILKIFTKNISVAMDYLAYLVSLEDVNSQLEQKVLERTQQLNIEKDKAEAANRAKSNFLSNISHEIRTPMNAILGYAQLLKNDELIPQDKRLELGKIEKAGQHLLELINGVLDISKIESGKMELQENTFELSHLLADISAMFELKCQQKGLAWQIENDVNTSYPVRGDLAKIKQVLTNLLANAIKFTEHGYVKLSVSSLDDNQYTFEVSDTGLGIDEHELNSLFDAFQQGSLGKKIGGTGLGLAISSRQIQLMASELKVKSKVGQGSKFWFQLQLMPGEVRHIVNSDKQIEQIKLKENCQMTALIVDDIEVNRAILANLFSRLGIQCHTAKNGLEAIAAVKAHAFDIIFMDILMPEMSGDEAIVKIRELYSREQLPCVAVSAYSMIHEIEYYINIGFERYVSKPFTFSDIFHCLLSFYPERFDIEKAENEELPVKESKPAITANQYYIPENYLTEMLNAAQLNQLSVLRKTFDQTSKEYPDTQPLIEILASLLNDYDTDGIIALLEEVKKNV